jgi:hypothetical protein
MIRSLLGWNFPGQAIEQSVEQGETVWETSALTSRTDLWRRAKSLARRRSRVPQPKGTKSRGGQDRASREEEHDGIMMR